MSVHSAMTETPDASSVRAVNLHHVGIDVEDLQAQTEFYRDAFGLDLLYEAALKEYRMTLVILASPAGWAIELFKRPGAKPRPVPEDADSQHDILGIGHLCFEVEDLRGMHDRLVGLGAKSLIGPSPAPVPGAGFAYLGDPEGNLIELATATWPAA